MHGQLVVLLVAAFVVILVWILLDGACLPASRTAADKRAEALLWEVLSKDERAQLARSRYLAVRSPSMPNRVYRIPASAGLVEVYDSGRLVMKLCARPVQRLPNPDVVVMHKLMIEGCERDYLKRANYSPADAHVFYV